MEYFTLLCCIVVPYIGTWIETKGTPVALNQKDVVPYIGTWIETPTAQMSRLRQAGRTLYRYVD